MYPENNNIIAASKRNIFLSIEHGPPSSFFCFYRFTREWIYIKFESDNNKTA